METRLELTEEGTAMEALLGFDGTADTPWRLNVKSFRLPGHLPSDSPKTAAADCMKKFGTFILSRLQVIIENISGRHNFGEDTSMIWTFMYRHFLVVYCTFSESFVDILDRVGLFLQEVKRALMSITDSRKKCWRALWKWILLQKEATCPAPLK